MIIIKITIVERDAENIVRYRGKRNERNMLTAIVRRFEKLTLLFGNEIFSPRSIFFFLNSKIMSIIRRRNSDDMKH